MCKEQIIREIIFVVGLAGCSYWDIKKKQIWTVAIIAMGLLGIIMGIIIGDFFSIDTLWVLLPGILAIILSGISKNAIGIGDSLFILVAGLYMNSQKMLEWGLIFLTLAGLLALVLILGFKKKKNYEIPMIPIMLGGYAIVSVLELYS